MCSGRGRQTQLWKFEVSLFGHPRITAHLPAPRGLSQAITSFIGSWCLGIHRLPLVACLHKTKNNHYKDARVHCEVLKIRAIPTHHNQPAMMRRSAQETAHTQSVKTTPQDPTARSPTNTTNHQHSTPTPHNRARIPRTNGSKIVLTGT